MQNELQLVDPDLIEFKFFCLRARQPIGDLYIAVIPFKTLIKITHFDVRRVLQVERDVERYLGIQRPLEDKRVGDLEKYVNYADATFPSAIILSVDENYANYDEVRREMILTNTSFGSEKPTIAISQIAKVLDGQHRIAGLSKFEGGDFDLPVTIFVGADISDQAHVFSTVNLEQTKVSKSLVYDLFSLARSRSPQKTCHNIAVALDRDEGGPLSQRIKRLGLATVGRVFEPITQATFVESLMPYLSIAPKEDRDFLIRGRSLEKFYGEQLFKVPFRNLFVDEKDIEITEIVHNYFSAVRRRWSDAWEDRGKGMMLNRTNGFRALMRFLRNAYLEVASPGDVPSEKRFADRVFASIDVRDDQFNTDNFPPGTSGEARLYRVLRKRESL